MKFLEGKKKFIGIILALAAIFLMLINAYLYYNKFKLYREIKKIEDGPQKQLYLAIVKGDVDLFYEALNKGADPDFDGYILIKKPVYIPPPIYYAIETKNVRILQILIDEGANVNKGFWKECFTPLHYAIKKGDCKIIGMLIGYGARRLRNSETCAYLNNSFRK